MKETDVHEELRSIRDLMERSSKFISLSGLSGVLAGIYALAGAGWAYMLLRNYRDTTEESYPGEPGILMPLFMIAIAVLVLSLVTGFLLSMRNAIRRNENVWNPVSRRLLAAVSVPMFTGAAFIAIMLTQGNYTVIASACLIFYGLALVAGSQYTFDDIRWLGICEILLGLFALIVPGYGLILWAVGFGLLHIIYGSVMHFKYER